MAKACLYNKFGFYAVWGGYTWGPHMDIPTAWQMSFSVYHWSGTGFKKASKESVPGMIVHTGNSGFKAEEI